MVCVVFIPHVILKWNLLKGASYVDDFQLLYLKYKKTLAYSPRFAERETEKHKLEEMTPSKCIDKATPGFYRASNQKYSTDEYVA